MADDIENLASMFQADHNEAESTKKRRVDDQRLIDDQSGDLWNIFKSEVSAGVESINSQVVNSLEFSLTCPNGAEKVQVNYDRGDGNHRHATAEYSFTTQIMTLAGRGTANCQYRIVADGTKATFHNGRNQSPADIAKQFLMRLL